MKIFKNKTRLDFQYIVIEIVCRQIKVDFFRYKLSECWVNVADKKENKKHTKLTKRKLHL